MVKKIKNDKEQKEKIFQSAFFQDKKGNLYKIEKTEKKIVIEKLGDEK